jgi:hypothetical protein
MNERRWKRLLRDVQEQRCILMLGPRLEGLQVNGQWLPLMESFAGFLTNELSVEKIDFDVNAAEHLPYIGQLFLKIPGVERIDLEDEIKSYYQQNMAAPPPLYRLLAGLPFSLVINSGFDNYMERAFNNEGKFAYGYYYNFRRQTPVDLDPESIDPQHPMVYNLFGSFEKPESLVITENDQVEFVRNVVKSDPGVPPVILEQFDHSKSYLFLGFNVEHWQFRLLLEALNLRESNATHSPNMDRYPVSPATRKFFEDRYKFHFIEKDAITFSNELIERLNQLAGEDEEANLPLRKIFIAYADEDESYARELTDFLDPLQEKGAVQVSHKAELPPGVDADEAITAALTEASVILLVISADFLADYLIKERELAIALERADNRSATVIPVIARACDWKTNSGLRKLAPLPLNGTPIQSNHWTSPDDAYLHIIKNLKKRIW